MKDRTVLSFGIIGVYVSLLLYSVFQEIITKHHWGDERFTFSITLVGLTCFFNVVCSSSHIRFRRSHSPTTLRTPRSVLLKIAFTYTGAMVASNLSLLYLSFIAKLLLKSCKMVPVLLAGLILRKQRYSYRKYFSVGLITAGVSSFMLFNTNSSNSETSSLPGIFLAILSLLLDGLTSYYQDICVANHKTTVSEFMHYVNLYGLLVTFIVSLITGELFSTIAFITRHPLIVFPLFGYLLTGALGQYCIYLVLSKSSALLVTTVTTTRKFFTVLISIVVFQNTLNFAQWCSVFAVFVGLTLDKFKIKVKSDKIKVSLLSSKLKILKGLEKVVKIDPPVDFKKCVVENG
ncbi:hypothetical protein P9112_004440 [Eukaryota sp. TZLM1-RC]